MRRINVYQENPVVVEFINQYFNYTMPIWISKEKKRERGKVKDLEDAHGAYYKDNGRIKLSYHSREEHIVHEIMHHFYYTHNSIFAVDQKDMEDTYDPCKYSYYERGIELDAFLFQYTFLVWQYCNGHNNREHINITLVHLREFKDNNVDMFRRAISNIKQKEYRDILEHYILNR